MSVGKQLLFSVLTAEPHNLRGEYLSVLTDAGVTEAMFPNEDEQRAFRFLTSYRLQYGVCPSLALVEVETDIRFPQYLSQNPFRFWFDEFRKYIQHTSLIDMITQVENHLADGRVETALDNVGDTYMRLKDMMLERKTCVTFSEAAHDVIERHNLLQNGMLHDGVYTGFPYLDEITGGVQPGDTWVIAGEPATGKTYILCRCAVGAVRTGKKVLFVSMEMSNLQVGRRSLAMGASVSANGMRLGRLSRFAMNQVQEFLSQWEHDNGERLIFVEGRVNYSVRDVKAKIREVKPDIVLLDGAYMIRSGKSFVSRWEMNLEVIETLKQIAMEDNIGMIATFQFDQKQRTKGLSTIMGGQAIGQIASVVIGIENEESDDDHESVKYKELTLYKGREGEVAKIRLRYDMNRTIIEQDAILSGNSDFNTGLHEHDADNILEL